MGSCDKISCLYVLIDIEGEKYAQNGLGFNFTSSGSFKYVSWSSLIFFLKKSFCPEFQSEVI